MIFEIDELRGEKLYNSKWRKSSIPIGRYMS